MRYTVKYVVTGVIKRYTVKYVVNGVINSEAPTNDLAKAIARESVLREKYGVDAVWIADSVTEIFVG